MIPSMKATISIVLACIMSIAVQAQTNFRQVSYTEALNLAKKEHKNVFIDFYTDWCAPCKRMGKVVFPQKKLGDYMNSRYVCLQLNAEKDGKALAKRFNVHAYPTFVVVDTLGKSLFQLVGAMEADRLINSINENTDPELSESRIIERYKANERTPQVVEFYINILMRSGKYDEGRNVMEEYFSSLSAEQRLRKENLYLFLRYTIDWNSPQAKFYIEHLQELDPSASEEINNRVFFLYYNEMRKCFAASVSKDNTFDKNRITLLEQKLHILTEKNQKACEPVLQLINIRMTKDIATYTKACVKEFTSLNSYMQECLSGNVGRLVEHEDSHTLAAIVEWLKENATKQDEATANFSNRFIDAANEALGKLKK